MTTEALQILEASTYIVLTAFMLGMAAFVSRKAGEEAIALLAFVSTPLRKLFDPGNIGAVFVRRVFKIDPAPVDAAAEVIADAIDNAMTEHRKV